MIACHHTFRPCAEHADYDVCCACGTYRSRVAPPPEDVYTADYWTTEQGHSTLEEQVYNCEEHFEGGVSKNAFLMNLIDTPGRTAALEIGCAPGALLGRLKREARFSIVDGIEVFPAWDEDIQRIAGARVYLWHGAFPRLSARMAENWYDVIIAADVFEHSHEPEAFILVCVDLLKPGGQLLLMTPLIDAAIDTPDRMWHPVEHVYLHSATNLCAMLKDAGFVDLTLSQWCPGHEVMSARKAAPSVEPIDYDSDGEGNCLP